MFYYKKQVLPSQMGKKYTETSENQDLNDFFIFL